ncbi:SDR family oxidoreductase [Stappia stellulata]|uniref:SDR family oxidoreductase n=1 Tax=Stappia stellulata TaxID=71235 RepID=UPI000427B95B|nr:SDR family oxidoreductase [Stappia stellulata]
MPLSSLVITGANRGIGLETVRRFLEDPDWQVIATCRNPDTASDLQALQARHGARLELHALDVGDAASVAQFADALSGRAVDVLLNNAGVMGAHQSLEEIDFDAWLSEFDVNTLGPMRLALALRPNLALSVAPRIMTISSQMGSMARPRGGSYAYRSSKAAVNKAMQGLSLDLAEAGVCVVVVHPGWVRTDMGGSGADISVEQSAAGIHRLALDLTLADSGRFLTYTGEDHPW